MGHDHSHGHSHGHGGSCSHDSKEEQAGKLIPKDPPVTPLTTTTSGGPNNKNNNNNIDHDHGHHDNHSNDDASREVLKRLRRAMFLCGSFLVVEVVGGYLAGSLAVLSDAAHLFADLASFAVAIAAAHLASLPTTDHYTFGLKRTESLAALLSMISLALVSLYLAVEAIRRLIVPSEAVDGKLMSQVAFIGVLVNIALAFVLGVENHIHLPGADHGHDHEHGHEHGHDHNKHEQQTKCPEEGHDHDHGHNHNKHESSSDTTHNHSHGHEEEETAPLVLDSKIDSYKAIHAADSDTNKNKPKPLNNINLQAAYLHVVGDLMQSLGVFIAGLAIWYNPKWTIIDPICTLLFCAVVFYSTLGVLRHSVAVLLQEVPLELSWQRIYETISNIQGVENVHDLHIWSISHGDPALAVHCSCGDFDPQIAMKQISSQLNQMGITHITIQMQQGDGECITCHQNGGCDAARLSKQSTTSSDGNQESNIV